MEPFIIPARGEAEIEYEVIPEEPGPFGCRPCIVYADRGIQGLNLSISGTWLASRSTDHDATPP